MSYPIIVRPRSSRIFINESRNHRYSLSLTRFSSQFCTVSLHSCPFADLAHLRAYRPAENPKAADKMATLSLSSPNALFLLRPINGKPPLVSPKPPLGGRASSFAHNPLRDSIGCERMALTKRKMTRSGGVGAVCYAAPLTARNLQWISTISSAVLMLAKGTPVQKSFLVPLFALQAPSTIISWMKGEYGIWAAFLALLVRLFFYIPGELELPFMALLLVIVAPYQVMNLRGTQEGAILAVLTALYLGYQQFSRTSLPKSFEQGSIVATIAIICIMVASLLFLI